MDNDRVMNTYTLYTINRFKRHLLHNTIQVLQGEQVFINRVLSAYNHDKTSYLWQPEADLYLHQYLRFINKYQLRADYEDYKYDDFVNDRFYRILNAEWGVCLLNADDYFYQIGDNSYIYFAFLLDNIETAERDTNIWYRNSSDYQKQYLLAINYQTKHLALKLQPVLKYYNDIYETEVQTDVSIRLQNLHLQASINPIAKQDNKMIWRFNFGVNYEF
jgi:hypothetical protein